MYEDLKDMLCAWVVSRSDEGLGYMPGIAKMLRCPRLCRDANLLERHFYFNFKQHQVSPAAYLPDWLVPLFLDHLPFEACARLWDILLLEGDSFLFRASLAILAVLEPRLFFPDRRELLELLKQTGSRSREARGRPLNGAKYEIYNVDEETLWERLDSMDELIQRELPDL
ncbi:uncharacterized protein B0H18DRAFT_970270 [Fomitopsis serialis]|uniref:uncharacterized protein n=1 Tax=Fomitopsis serialis TaxID=139415 RepID=UPI002008CBDD|nr:uncharacterized protein B0H18DRAFT_970270 [Neoantrodia serialis]KAH9937372.1 hypothetical protein B0H18DRAFT_970270 [Neoantrodia serialis]